jgi:Fe-S-cluster containining protein
MTKPHDEDWYEEGLRFTCTQCGNCCSGPSGFVWFSDEEAQAMADHLELPSVQAFRAMYAHQIGGRWSLAEIASERGNDCVFLRFRDGKAQCSIYPVRPTQCRTWPFWPENLKSFRTYVSRAAKRCPGTTRGLEGSGKFYPIEQIRILRDSTPHDES